MQVAYLSPPSPSYQDGIEVARQGCKMKMHFRIYGTDENAFTGALTLDNLQRLADAHYFVKGSGEVELVSDQETRREILKWWHGWHVECPSPEMDNLPIRADALLPPNIIAMRKRA
jgi:hypothetical protein